MNHANAKGDKIEDGDYAIIDSNDVDATTGNVVLAIVDGRGTIKRFIDDRAAHGQIVLKSDSSFDYDPIYLHPDDDFTISGKVVGVIKQPIEE